MHVSTTVSEFINSLNVELPVKKLNSFGKDKNSRVYNLVKYATQNSTSSLVLEDTDKLLDFIINVLL